MTSYDWLIPVHRRARALLAVDRPYEAGRHLARALRRLDPVLAPPQPRLIAVAALYAGTPFPNIDATSRFEWGRYAHRASTCFPRGLQLQLAAAEAYDQVLGEQNLTFDVMRIRQHRVAILRRCGTTADSLRGRRDLALALHGDGWCDDARTEITATLTAWQSTPFTTHAAGVSVLLSAAVIHASCGQSHRAVEVMRSHARLLPFPGSETAAEAAEWIARAEIQHPRSCEQPVQHIGDGTTVGDRLLHWLTVIACCYQPPPLHSSDTTVPDHPWSRP